MGLADKIVKHAYLVIALWIIALIALTPLALKLDEVLSYEETSFLPENTESVIADEILKEKFNTSMTMYTGVSVLLVTGINASEEDSWRAYNELKKSIEGKYATNITGYYDVYSDINDSSYNLSYTLVLQIVNATNMMKNLTLTLIENYNETIDHIKSMKEMVVNTSIYYNTLLNNITQLHQMIYGVRNGLTQLDQGYLWLRENITMLHDLLVNINETTVELNNAFYTIDYQYKKLYFDISRTYYYLTQLTDAYQTGTLDEEDIGTVVYYTGMSNLGSVDFYLVGAVFETTYPIVGSNTDLMNDLIIANITRDMLIEAITTYYQVPPEMEPVLEQLINNYNNYFTENLLANETEDYKLLLNMYSTAPDQAGSSQDQVYYTILSIASNIPDSMKPVLAYIISEESSNYGLEIPYDTALYMATNIVDLGPQPTLNSIKGVVVNTTTQLIYSLSIPIPATDISSLLNRLYDEGVTTSLLQELFIESLQNQEIPPTERAFLELCLDKVLEVDVNATGILLENETLLRKATIEVSQEIIPSQPVPLTSISKYIGALYDLGPTPDRQLLENVTKDIVYEMLLTMASNYTSMLPIDMPLDMVREFIGLVVNTSIRVDYTSESSVYGAVYSIVKELINMTGSGYVDVIDRVFHELYFLEENASIEGIRVHVVNPLFKDMVEEMAGSFMGEGVPEEFREEIGGVVGWIIDNYPLSSSDVRDYVVNKVYSSTVEFLGENMLFKDLLERMDLYNIIDRAYDISLEDEKALENLALDVKPVFMDMFLDYMSLYLETMKSSDNTTLLITFTPLGSSDEEKYENALEVKEKALEIYGRSYSGLEAYVTGGVVASQELKEVGLRDVRRVQQCSYLLTLIVLFIVVEALFAVVVPFISIGAAIMLASGVVYLVATYVMDISSWARVLMTTTALGLGIDYTTFYLHRLREMLGKGMGFEEAVAEAIRRARDGILASASTDIIGFAVLMIAWDFPFLRVIGVTVPIAIFSVFLASLTLIPALTAVIGKSKWFWWPRKPSKKLNEVVSRGSRVVNAIIRGRFIVLLLFIVLSIPAVYTFITFQGSHDIKLYLPEGTETERAYAVLEDKIGAATTSPLYVVIELSGEINDAMLGDLEKVANDIASLDYVRVVYAPTRPYGETLEYLSLEYVRTYNGTVYISSDNNTVMFRVVLTVPGESDEARDTVREIRSILKEYVDKDKFIVGAYVGGLSASMVDLDEMLNESFWHKIIPVAVVLMFIALTLTLKGVIAALVTLCIIGVGTTWSIWVSTIMFQGLFGKPLLWFLPLVLLVVLLGVGVDYNSFYLVRVRDEMEEVEPKKALSIAARASGRLIIGLALILSSAYTSLVLTSMWAMREIGFVLTLGIMIIALSAVYIVSPAIISMFRHHTWWPFKLRRRLEGVDED